MDKPGSASARSRYEGLEPVPLEITVRVGEVRASLRRVVGLQAGDVLRLTKPIGEPFELLCGDVVLARVEPVAHETGIAAKLVGIPEGSDASGS